MTNSKPKNQLSFVREILEVIYKNRNQTVLNTLQNRYNISGRRNLSISHYLQNICQDKENNLFLDPYTQIYLCIKFLQEYILYSETNKINEDGILEDLTKIRNSFQEMLNQGLNKKFKSHREGPPTQEEQYSFFSTPYEYLDFYISILKKIESRYPKYEITDEEIEQYRTTINEMIEAIKNANLPPDVKSKIFKNLLEIKQMLDNIYAFSREDIEKEIIYNCTLWNQLDESNEFIQENKPKFLRWAKDFMENIVSKMKDPSFISETILRGTLGTEITEGVKHLPEVLDKILPPH